MDKKVLVCTSGKGKEVADYLREQLNIPGRVYEFKVIFSLDDAVRVECGYYPTEKKDNAG